MGDEVVLEEDGVRITTAVVAVGGTRYPLAGITSVQVRTIRSSNAGGAFFGVLGMLVLMSGVLALLLGAMILMDPEVDMGLAGLLASIGAGLLLFGVAGVAAASKIRAPRPRFTVMLGTAGGDRSAYTTLDRDLADRIAAAIEQAIVLRG